MEDHESTYTLEDAVQDFFSENADKDLLGQKLLEPLTSRCCSIVTDILRGTSLVRGKIPKLNSLINKPLLELCQFLSVLRKDHPDQLKPLSQPGLGTHLAGSSRRRPHVCTYIMNSIPLPSTGSTETFSAPKVPDRFEYCDQEYNSINEKDPMVWRPSLHKIEEALKQLAPDKLSTTQQNSFFALYRLAEPNKQYEIAQLQSEDLERLVEYSADFLNRYTQTSRSNPSKRAFEELSTPTTEPSLRALPQPSAKALNDLSRSTSQRTSVTQRDHGHCLVTGMKHADKSHICPFAMLRSMNNSREENKRDVTWNVCRYFWTEEEVDRWLKAVLPEISTAKGSGQVMTETAMNILTLHSTIHNYWNYGEILFLCLKESEDSYGCYMKVRLYITPEPEYDKDVKVDWTEPLPQDTSQVAHRAILEDPEKHYIDFEICSRKDLNNHCSPLPARALFDMQWRLGQAICLRGAAGTWDPFLSDSEDSDPDMLADIGDDNDFAQSIAESKWLKEQASSTHVQEGIISFENVNPASLLQNTSFPYRAYDKQAGGKESDSEQSSRVLKPKMKN